MTLNEANQSLINYYTLFPILPWISNIPVDVEAGARRRQNKIIKKCTCSCHNDYMVDCSHYS